MNPKYLQMDTIRYSLVLFSQIKPQMNLTCRCFVYITPMQNKQTNYGLMLMIILIYKMMMKMG